MTATEFPPALAALELLRQQLERSVEPDAGIELRAELERGVTELRQRHPQLIDVWCEHHIAGLRRDIAWTEATLARITDAHGLDSPRQRNHAAVAGGMMMIEIDESRMFLDQWQQVRGGERDFVLHLYSR